MDLRNFLALSSLLLCVTPLSLQLDGYMQINYIFIFLPLWLLWKLSVFASTIIGAIVLLQQSWYQDIENNNRNMRRIQVILAVHNLLLHILLTAFECLLCIKLNSTSGDAMWITVFSPAVMASALCTVYCCWCCRNRIRVFNMELFIAMNLLVFILVPLRLDNTITCPWEMVFLPLLIILFVALIRILYSLVFCSISHQYADVDVQSDERKIARVILFALTFFPIFISQALLVDKLDDGSEISFTLVTLPLVLSLIAAIALAFLSNQSESFNLGSFSQLLSMMGIYGDILSINSCYINRRDDEDDCPSVSDLSDHNKIPSAAPYSFELPD